MTQFVHAVVSAIADSRVKACGVEVVKYLRNGGPPQIMMQMCTDLINHPAARDMCSDKHSTRRVPICGVRVSEVLAREVDLERMLVTLCTGMSHTFTFIADLRCTRFSATHGASIKLFIGFVVISDELMLYQLFAVKDV